MTAPVVERTELDVLAARSALLASIKAQVDLEAAAAKEALEAAMRANRKRGGAKTDVSIPDEYGADGESVVATAAFNKDGKPTVFVKDGPGCLEWVAERHPEQIQEVVHPTYMKHLLGALSIKPGGVVVDEHGELIEWAGVAPGAPGSLVLKFTGNAEGKARLLQAWLDGQLPEDVRPLKMLPAPERSER